MGETAGMTPLDMTLMYRVIGFTEVSAKNSPERTTSMAFLAMLSGDSASLLL